LLWKRACVSLSVRVAVPLVLALLARSLSDFDPSRLS
jgi:hypothetical protein